MTQQHQTIDLVIGANRGIGRASAHRLARGSAHVIVAARSAAGAQEVAAELTRAGQAANSVTLDVTDPAQVHAAAAEVIARAATLPASAPSRTFVDATGVVAW